jgi:hypothetical protein
VSPLYYDLASCARPVVHALMRTAFKDSPVSGQADETVCPTFKNPVVVLVAARGREAAPEGISETTVQPVPYAKAR